MKNPEYEGQVTETPNRFDCEWYSSPPMREVAIVDNETGQLIWVPACGK